MNAENGDMNQRSRSNSPPAVVQDGEATPPPPSCTEPQIERVVHPPGPSAGPSSAATQALAEPQIQPVVAPPGPSAGIGGGVSYGTQTERDNDVVDGVALIQPHPLINPVGHHDGASSDGGLFSSLSSLFTKRKGASPERNESSDEEGSTSNSHTVATQTEEQDPIVARGQQLSYLLIEELALERTISSDVKDEVYDSLASCVCDMLVKHSILFSGMVRRCHVNHYHVFACIANEIFEAERSENDERITLRITWGRIISLFAFAVRFAQEYREDREGVESIIRFLASYVTRNIVAYVRSNGGWESLVVLYPPPTNEDVQMKRALMWSSVCVGLMATMYVTSMLSSR